MNQTTIHKKISRFKWCDRRFHPYIEKVLTRIPEDVCQGLLDNLGFEIISFGPDCGRFYLLENEIKGLVILNEKNLAYPEHEIIHTVAHEIAHAVIKKGETGLYEKEAEELLIKWGFQEEVEKADYASPYLESEGYQIGYEWAKTQKDLSRFEDFYNEWNEDRLSQERLEELHYLTDPTGILYRIRTPERSGKIVEIGKTDDGIPITADERVVQEMDETVLEGIKAGKVPINSDFSMDRGIIWGIMGFLKEERERWKKGLSESPQGEGKLAFIETLERIYEECNKLFQDNEVHAAFFGNSGKYPEVRTFLDSIAEVGGVLDELRSKERE